MSELQRLKELKDTEGMTIDDLSEKTGIKNTRMRNLLGGKTPVRIDDIQTVGQAFPEYKYWLAFGEEIPEAGQISPATKRAQELLKTTGKVG